MRILGDAFIARFRGRLLNIHPSLLPKYRGLHTHARALEAGDREHGASVHFVIPELDAGTVVAQVRVPVLAGDNPGLVADEEHNRVTLDPVLKDSNGIPAPRIHYTMGENTKKMMDHGVARSKDILAAAGATVVTAIPRAPRYFASD